MNPQQEEILQEVYNLRAEYQDLSRGLTDLKSQMDGLDSTQRHHKHLGIDNSSTLINVDRAIDVRFASVITINASAGNTFRVTLTNSVTLGNPENAQDGQSLAYELIQDGTGSRTVTLGSKFAFGTSITAFTATTTASKRDYLGVKYSADTDKFYVVALAQGY